MMLRRYAALALLADLPVLAERDFRAATGSDSAQSACGSSSAAGSANAGQGSKRSDRAHQGRGHESFTGNADAELSDRRHWSSSYQFAGNETSKRMDARSNDQVGIAERPSRSMGTIWSRLDAKAIFRAGG